MRASLVTGDHDRTLHNGRLHFGASRLSLLKICFTLYAAFHALVTSQARHADDHPPTQSAVPYVEATEMDTTSVTKTAIADWTGRYPCIVESALKNRQKHFVINGEAVPGIISTHPA